MKLQLALDFIDIDGAKAVLREVADVIDIVEIGTPFIVKDGIKAITEIKNSYPALKVLADIKIMDAGEYEAKLAFDAGADIVTVLGDADDATVDGVVKAARKFDKEVMVDMISVADITKRATQIDKMEVDYICVHTAFDVQNQDRNPLEELKLLRRVVKKAKAAVAGGIKINTLKQIIPYKPEIVIVGSSITGRKDKRKAALEMKQLLK